MEEVNRKAIIEAILFSSDKPVLIEQIKDVFGDIASQDIREIITELNNEYIRDKRGIKIVEVAGGFQMVTPEEFHPYIKKFFKGNRKERLSKAALETLAIIAYKQPITKLQIESLRKVNVDRMLISLKELGLIRTVGRRKAPGRPYLYGTTRQFLEFFGLNSLEDLPKVEDLTTTDFTFGNYKNGKEKDGDSQITSKDRSD